MISVKNLRLLISKSELDRLPEGKLLINTINAFSYNNARKDPLFEEALMYGDVLIPDGVSIVRACHILNAKSKPWERIAGWDLFVYEMSRMNEPLENQQTVPYWKKVHPERTRPVVMFMGSSERVLGKIREQAAKSYKNIDVVTYSPPFRPQFTLTDNMNMCKAINDADPDLLWIGMTAPKQEKWAYSNWVRLNINCHCGTVGAVFDFFAGTLERAPLAWQQAGYEWLYRLLKEPKRMWRRYIIGNTEFLYLMFREWAKF